MKGHKRYRSGAWRLSVNVGIDAQTGRRRVIYETVVAPDNRAGAKLADARLAELINAVETGREVETRAPRRREITVAELAERWQRANRPRQNERTGDWIGWSPKTAKTNADNFRVYILPVIGRVEAARLSGLTLDDLYRALEEDRGLSPSVVVRCHSQIRAMYSWAMRKKLVASNPTMSADPPKVKRTKLRIPSMAEVRAVQDVATPDFSCFVQLAVTVGTRRRDARRAALGRRRPRRPSHHVPAVDRRVGRRAGREGDEG